MLDQPPIALNEEFRDILERLETSNTSMFITGRAGTGKSTLLRLFRETTNKKVVVVAPTGIAALNVQGQTIHSFFGFPPRPLTKAEIKPRRFKHLYKRLDTIIIDEISMVRADMLDNIDYFLRINGGNPNLPFGGKQVVFFGDLFQLPPVVSREEAPYFQQQYSSPYFFSAEVFLNFELEKFELSQVFRQEERGFVRLLDTIRMRRFDYDDLETLNERYLEDSPSSVDGYVTLTTRNSIVNEINSRRLKQLDGIELTYTGSVEGDFSTRVFPTDIILKLKEGAQVMFVKNDPKKRFVNGTIGQIVELQERLVRVAVPKPDGQLKVIDLEQVEWEILRYQVKGDELEAKPIGKFKQYPLRLAWAMTIHKSQGKTFDQVLLDLGKGAFAPGQTYVALSRCTTLGGIILKQPIRPRDVLIDERIVEYYERYFY